MLIVGDLVSEWFREGDVRKKHQMSEKWNSLLLCGLIICAFASHGTWACAETPPASPVQAERSSDVELELSHAVTRLGASEFSIRRQAFLDIWRAGEKSLPVLESAKQVEDRQIAEVIRVLETLIELNIAPGNQEQASRLLKLTLSPSARDIVELCELGFWSVAERCLVSNLNLSQSFQEPYGRYLLNHIVETALEQGHPDRAWPIIRHVCPDPLAAWIAAKVGLELEPLTPSEDYARAWQLYFQGEVQQALELEIPEVAKLPMITRAASWDRLLQESTRLVLLGREQTAGSLAGRAVLLEFDNQVAESEALWDELLVPVADTESESGQLQPTELQPSESQPTEPQHPDAQRIRSAVRLLRQVSPEQTVLNQLLAALTLAGQVEAIEEYMLEQQPAAAFNFVMSGGDYRRALTAVGLQADLVNLPDWLEQRSTLIALDLAKRPTASERFDGMARVCDLVCRLGYHEESQSILNVMVELTRDAGVNQVDLWSRLLSILGSAEPRNIAIQAAKQELPRLPEETQAVIMEGLFPDWGSAGHALFQTAPGANLDQRWENIERLWALDGEYFHANTQSQVAPWLRRAKSHLSKERLSSDHLVALAEIAAGFGDSELAIELLRADLSSTLEDPRSANRHWFNLAQLLVDKGATQSALPLFKHVRKSGMNYQVSFVSEIEALLACGEAGEAVSLDRSRWLRPLATTRFMDGAYYLQVAKEFLDGQRSDRAIEYAEAAFLLSDLGGMDVYWGAADFAKALEEVNDYTRSADVQRAALVESLQPYSSGLQFLIGRGFFASFRFSAQRERLIRAVACIERGDFAEASRHIHIGRQIKPQDIEMVVQCYPRLIKADQIQLATEIFEDFEHTMLAQIASWPRDATAHNNLAWMYSQCDLKLDEAKELALKAVSLAPNSAVYLDTLAEVEYRSGELEKALETARQCVRLDPRETHYRENLVRFRQ
jgi:tetratricopeptide (TPR) repeat protein